MKKFLYSLFALVATPLVLFAEEAAEPAASRGSFMQTLIMIGIAVVFFYFILWRPEQKRRKTMEKKRSEMKKGDRVTAVGIVGIVDKIKEQTIILKNVDGSKIEVLKGAVSEVKSASEGATEEQAAPQAS